MAPKTRFAHEKLRLVHAVRSSGFTTDSASQVSPDVFVRIGEPICRLLGNDGYRALLERALVIASEDYSVLKTVRPAIAPAGRLAGLSAFDVPRQRREVSDALNATLAVARALLTELLGGDLVHEVFGLAETQPCRTTTRQGEALTG